MRGKDSVLRKLLHLHRPHELSYFPRGQRIDVGDKTTYDCHPTQQSQVGQIRHVGFHLKGTVVVLPSRGIHCVLEEMESQTRLQSKHTAGAWICVLLL